MRWQIPRCRQAVKDFSPVQQEALMDQTSKDRSISRKSRVLGIGRQSYYRRKQGHRPEEKDQEIATLLHQTVGMFVAWGFWMVFHYLRRQGHTWNT